VIGGAGALINMSNEVKQAIIAGVVAPALIANLIAGANDPQGRKRADFFITSAYAQMASDTPGESGAAALIVVPKVFGGVPNATASEVIAKVEKDGKEYDVKVGKITDFDSATGFLLPIGTKRVTLFDKSVAIVNPITNVEISVTTKPTSKGDFFWALGAQREYSIQKMDITPSPAR
jgi:hypothetical protein